MRKRTALLARLERLERQRVKRRWPGVVSQVYDDEPEAALGFEADNLIVMRQGGETAQECAERAFALSGCAVIAAIMPEPPESAPERVSEPSGHPATPQAANDVPSDPFALAGIGRRATRKELERMGMIAVPPERLV